MFSPKRGAAISYLFLKSEKLSLVLMKIAIVSDLHIGYERFFEDAAAQARRALEMASQMADAIIIPGDVFDKRAPQPNAIAQAINIFRDLLKAGSMGARVSQIIGSQGKNYTDYPVVAIPGTHERTAIGRENALQLLSLAGLLVDTSEATTIIEKGGERVAVFGLGGISEERVVERLKELSPKPVEGAFNIFMFHQSTYELLPFSDDFMHNEDLPKGFDLYVDGHIHNRVEMSVHGKYLLIPGSTVLTQLKDGEQEDKGFILFDTGTGRYEFIPINSRRFVVERLAFKEAKPADVTDRVARAIEKNLAAGEMPIIKVYLEGSIAHGFTSTDMALGHFVKRYQGRALVEIDGSRLKNIELEGEIESLRDNRIGDMSVRERGMEVLLARLKELGFDSRIDVSELFNALSSDEGKEEVARMVEGLINSGAQEG